MQYLLYHAESDVVSRPCRAGDSTLRRMWIGRPREHHREWMVRPYRWALCARAFSSLDSPAPEFDSGDWM